MATKALLFLSAFVLLLLVSTQLATSTEEEISTDHLNPSDAPEDSSIKAQITCPPKFCDTLDASHQRHDHGDCVKLCDGDKGYCRSKDGSKRECERACVPCCDHYKCVPEATGKCTSWDKVWHDNQEVKCP